MPEVTIKVDSEILRRARVRAFELGTTVEKALGRLLVHLATAPSPAAQRRGDTGERSELQRAVSSARSRRPGASGSTG